jgi:hypothetical protein
MTRRAMERDYEIVWIQLRRDGDGLYTATSPDLQGVCVVHRDKAAIIEDMPNIVKLWYRRHRGIEVEPFWGATRDIDGASDIPFLTIPAQIAAQQLGR